MGVHMDKNIGPSPPTDSFITSLPRNSSSCEVRHSHSRSKIGVLATDQEEECAICTNKLVSNAVTLPCACALRYCFDCWVHALSSSWMATGHARCPSCRGAVRVDFDSENEGIIFSPLVVEESKPEHHARIRDQVRPYQFRLLEKYRAASSPDV